MVKLSLSLLNRHFPYILISSTPICFNPLFYLNDLLHSSLLGGSLGSKTCESAADTTFWPFVDVP
jgi:hypothetical protein